MKQAPAAATGDANPSATSRVIETIRQWRQHPNPILVRELRQLMRLQRTPWLLMIVVILGALILSAAAGLMGNSTPSPGIGLALYQIFFSFAWFFVTVMAPAVAANSIAAERQGKTWEALLLTGMRPRSIIRGKFLAALVKISTYVLFAAPLAGLSLVFGGVSLAEVLLAFVLLLTAGFVGTAFGLAISSAVASVRIALILSLVIATPISSFTFGIVGFGGAALASSQWLTVPDNCPVWLPLALLRAEFNTVYALFLLLLPGIALFLPLWLLYEVACNNVRSARNDRAFGIKRWYVGAIVAAATTCSLSWYYSPASARDVALLASTALVGQLALLGAFLLAIDGPGPSARVRRELATRSWLRRWFGPSLIRSSALQFMGTACLLGLLLGLGHGGSTKNFQGLLIGASFTLAFCSFSTALVNWLRSRNHAPMAARLILGATLFGLAFVPWLLAATLGLSQTNSDLGSIAYTLAAPSVFYTVYTVESMATTPVVACIAATTGYASLAVFLTMLARARCRQAEPKATADAAATPARGPSPKPKQDHGTEVKAKAAGAHAPKPPANS